MVKIFLIVQYADYTLLFMEACPIQLFTVNKMLHLAKTFNCHIGSFPFTYLGLPLSLAKPKVVDFVPLIKIVERRLCATSAFLFLVGRLELANSCFSSLPTFYMCTLRLLAAVIS